MTKQRWRRVGELKTIFSITQAGHAGWLLGTDQGVWLYSDHIASDTCVIVSESLRPVAITAVAASPTYPEHPVILIGAADGIARSTDNGQHWVGATAPQPSQISQLVMSPAFESDGRAFAATFQDGVMCSSDYGASWNPWNFGLLDMETLILAISPLFSQDETIVVATVHGVFRSTNGGHAWRELSINREVLPLSGIAFAGSLLFIGSETQGLSYSLDYGNTWLTRSSFKSGQINALASSPDGMKLVLATPTVVAVSSNQGVTWDRTEGHTPRGIISLAVADDSSILCGTQEDGFWVYRNGSTA